MTDAVGRTLDRLAARVSTLGNDGDAAATAIWSKSVGRMPRAVVHCQTGGQRLTERSDRGIPMNGIEKQAAFYRGYLTDERSLVPLTIVLATVVALWLLVYLLAAVAEAPQDAGAGCAASITFIRDRPAASSPIQRDSSARTFPRCCATADN